jgi:hypothetical protein
MSGLLEERWLMTAEFDSVQDTIDAGVYEGGLGEAAEFYEFCRRQAEEEWGFLNEEIGEGVQMEGETVRVSLNINDPFEDLFRWLLAYTSPKSVTLTRTEPR